jgi:hypothetical protein
MKNYLLSLIFLLISLNAMSQEMMVVNPQFNQQTFYRDIENLWYIPGIDKKKYAITAIPSCKIEKSVYTDDSGASYTCFKVSEIPDVKFVVLTLTSPGKAFGNFKFKVMPKAPK